MTSKLSDTPISNTTSFNQSYLEAADRLISHGYQRPDEMIEAAEAANLCGGDLPDRTRRTLYEAIRLFHAEGAVVTVPILVQACRKYASDSTTDQDIKDIIEFEQMPIKENVRLFALVVTLVELLLLLVVAEAVYSIQLKAGFPSMLLLFLPAILATAFLGLTVSALARAQAQVGLASALFFLAIILLTGFFAPLEEASGLVRALSQLFPLTLLLPVFKAWTVGAQPSDYAWAVSGLWVQCVVYGSLSIAAVRLAIRRV